MAAVSPDRVRAAVSPVVEHAGFDLEDLVVRPVGRRNVVRVVVDRDGGVDLDAIADVSRLVSDALDGSDAMGAGAYTLEVTSPGVDRPLTEPRHWRRAVGRLVATPAVTGRVVAADDEGVILDVDGTQKQLSYDEAVPGHVQVEFRSGGAR
jgi:ribosome maturation factor RimP